jgi:hypothetical protein
MAIYGKERKRKKERGREGDERCIFFSFVLGCFFTGVLVIYLRIYFFCFYFLQPPNDKSCNYYSVAFFFFFSSAGYS